MMSGCAYGTTYHVATDGSGDFTTIAQVQTAYATFIPGDSILFRKGDTWDENWDVSGIAGDATNNITIGAYGTGDLPKIQYLHQWATGEDYLTIENLYIRGVAGAGNVVQIYGGQNITIQNCTVDTNGVDLSKLINIASLTSGREVYNINIIGCTGLGGGVTAGFNVQGDNLGAHDIVFSGNTLTDCVEIGLQSYAVSSETYNITFSGNIISGTTTDGGASHGINIGWLTYNSVIEKNYCYDNEGFGIVMDAGVHDITVRNNICVNNGNSLGAQGNTYGQIYNIYFYNNTLVYGVGTTYAGLFLNIDVGGHDIYFKNNTVVSNDLRDEIMDDDDNFTNIFSDNNVFLENGDVNGPRFRYNSTNIYLIDWQATGQDTNSIAQDPLLNADYTLQSTSPCIDTGATLSEVTDDYNDNPRPLGGNHDIGATEWYSKKIRNATLKDCTI